jgi:quercetin dioxygenase-like cupin family protein
LETWDINSIDVEPRQPEVLRTDPEARLIVINLPAGAELGEHQVHERAYLVVADGEIEVQHEGRTEGGGPGFLAHFQAGERHTVRATSDARVLLILAPWTGEGHPRGRSGGGPS